MPFSGGVASALSVGAKTWRPKTADQQLMEVEQKRLTEEEQMKRLAIQKKIETLENVRKLEAKTQALNEMAMAAEIRSQEHEVAMKERRVVEARRAELAKLELAKRLGRESLSEADLARIRRERMKAELLARAAGNHATQEHMRPLNPNTIGLGPSRISVPGPPPLPFPSHPISVPRMPSAAGHHHHHHPQPPVMMPPMPRPPTTIPMPLPPGCYHNRVPSEPAARMRRMSGGMPLPPPSLGLGAGRGQWGLPTNALRGPTAGGHLDRPLNSRSSNARLRPAYLRGLREESLAQLALRAQAERLRRRRLESLDLKARQHNLRAQALRDLRKRELAAKLRERGLQQREIESQVRMMAEREAALDEAELRALREREHRVALKERGLQEREIVEQIRRQEERDRELMRNDMERLEAELRRAELLDAELAIKQAAERGQSPPLGVLRPSLDEIENEGLLCEDFFDEFQSLDPRLREEIMAASANSGDLYPGSRSSMGQRTPNPEHRRTPSMETRTPLMRGVSPGPAAQMRERVRDEQIRLSEDNRAREEAHLAACSRPVTPRIRDEMLSQMTPRLREEELENERRGGSLAGGARREEMLGDSLSSGQLIGRPRSQSFDRRSPGMSSRDGRGVSREEAGAREREEIARIQQQESIRRREDLRAREDQNRMNPDRISRNPSPLASQHRRTPSMRDNLDPSMYDSARHLDLPMRSASRASMKGGGELDDLPRSVSRSGSIRDGYSPAPERLGLPSRPSSRNLTVEDLGLDFAAKLRASSREREREPKQFTHDDLVAARLQHAQVNSQWNGGQRSRANSRAERVDADLLRSGARGQMSQDLGLGGRRSRANSRAELPSDDLLRSASRNQLGTDLGPNSAGRRSRAGSVNQSYGGPSSRSPRPSEFSELALQEEALRAREGRGPSRNISSAASPHGYNDAGWGALSNEELRELSTEQLEMLLLSETGSQTGIGSARIPMMSSEEIMQLTAEELDAILDDGAGVSGGRRSLSRRPSRGSGLGDSPPFGGASDLPTRSRSRNENLAGGRYGGAASPNPIRSTSTRLNPSSSLYTMPGQYEPYNEGPEDLDVGEFVITEQYEHPNTRIIEQLGTVRAEYVDSGRHPAPHNGLDEGNASHSAVNNLITEASQIGANGVIGLRVMDYPGGRYVAEGEAVVLTPI
ncbi:hypothetical protein CROQUDRAFT_665411 [Cronartium quercuum f. sp. fusiforme G11]|uniref:Uncharacterized protein n=1 Tax=Cronartium quercuum f. sp. fusiforme G11 TaxID=708437 RepID=A0A9P6N7A2_9BASI|nr:hypothetical protein CROQUDRAFT_665411 [Cronartium quercuum f. sp. fusiforme G11]